MKRLKVLFIILCLLVNFTIARPVWADRPPLDQNPDYIAITESLTTLTQARDTDDLPANTTLAEVESQIRDLQYQKYILETGKDTTCQNNTTQPVAVYGQKPKRSTATYEQVLYVLPPGEETDDDWVCQGVYLPSDAQIAGLPLNSAAAVKILAGTRLVLSEDPETGVVAFNLPPASVFKSGDVNWEIPNLTQADLPTQLPVAPLD